MDVQLYSDFVCPYCYIAERGPLSRLAAEYDIRIDWRGFELHPETPAGGIAVASLFPHVPLERMRTHIAQFAAQHGVEIGFQKHLPNTRRALAVAELARERGGLTPFRERTMRAHWFEGRDIEDGAVLGELGAEAGLDRDEAAAAAEDPQWLGRVDAMRREAHSRGVTGIPTVFFETLPVIGCHDYATFERVAQRVGVPRRETAS